MKGLGRALVCSLENATYDCADVNADPELRTSAEAGTDNRRAGRCDSCHGG